METVVISKSAELCGHYIIYACACYVRIRVQLLADGDEQERPAHRMQRVEAKTVRTRRGQKVGEVNGAEGCSTLAALSGKR